MDMNYLGKIFGLNILMEEKKLEPIDIQAQCKEILKNFKKILEYRSNTACYICRQKGHWAKECPKAEAKGLYYS